ncbi:hypothetical protein E3O44_06255 [Cryobacterium algoricola]|uniref:Autophagy-related protein 2 n=1 Tax=Cryobacterium algoricola TaxID=1259183 RepID=A0ABY2IED4_9MICO|nr:hypothetical protein [Cryobacterium algoricola]TFB88267.1 hypothetical protein E3O44_06255 [Cryobacterium algoricola]
MNSAADFPPEKPRVTIKAVSEPDEKGEYTDLDEEAESAFASDPARGHSDEDSASDSNGPANPGGDEGEYTDVEEAD